MNDEAGGPAGRRWHRALTQAITGDSGSDMGLQNTPDTDGLAGKLLATLGASALAAHRHEVLLSGDPWPHPVATELMAGLGYAQFAAALTRLIQDLGLDEPGVVAASGTTAPMTPVMRRLMEEVPPHHGS